MQITALLATALLSTFAHSATDDPLFQRMEGHWIGQGERVQLGSGRRIAIEAEVDSRIDDANPARLISLNHIRETADNGATRRYSRRYWIRHLGGASYQLGASGELPLTGTRLRGALPADGTFSGDTFTVRQQLGGAPPLRVESVTNFEPDATHFHERLWEGDRVLSETHLDYGRVTPPR